MGGDQKTNQEMNNLFRRIRFTWAIMPTWAKVADSIIVGVLVSAAIWLMMR